MLPALLLALVSASPAERPPTDPPGATTPAERPLEVLPQVGQDEARARAAWEEGAQAYREGRLPEAIAAFEESFRYSGRSGPLFSLGQAHRRRWELEGDHTQRELAIRRFEQYLQVDPEGRRQLEATRYIAELGRHSELEGLGDPPPVFTRLSVSSPTEGAVVSIDGAERLALPVTPDVEPGAHQIVVSAPGFHPQSRRVDIPEGSTVTLELTLQPVPARLHVEAPEGSDLYIDGQRIVRLPHREPIAVDPGVHQVGVARRGRSLFVRELSLARGEAHHLDAALEVTGQRKMAYAAIGLGAGATVAGAVLTGLSLVAQREALAIEDAKSAQGSISIERERERRALVERRDTTRAAAIASGVSGLVVMATGIVLHLTDRPPVASQLRPPTAGRRRPIGPVAGQPVLGPRYAGASLGGRF